MANTLVDNNILTDYPVLRDVNAADEQMQVVRLDIGVGTAEDRVTNLNGLPITPTAPAAPTGTVMHNATTTPGNGTPLDVGGYANAVIYASGGDSFDPPVFSFEASADGTNYVGMPAIRFNQSSGGWEAVRYGSLESANDQYFFNTAGLKYLRVVLLSATYPYTAKGYPSIFSGQLPSVAGSTFITGYSTNYVADVSSLYELIVSPRMYSTASMSNVSASASSVTIKNTNSSRRSFSVFNDSTVSLYLKFGTSASTTSFTVKVLPGQYYEMPNPLYTGAVTGVWDSATGTARVTENA